MGYYWRDCSSPPISHFSPSFDWKWRSVSGETSCSIQGQRRLDHLGYAHTLILLSHLIWPLTFKLSLGFSEYLNVVYGMETSASGTSILRFVTFKDANLSLFTALSALVFVIFSRRSKSQSAAYSQSKPRISDYFDSLSRAAVHHIQPISSPPIILAASYTHSWTLVHTTPFCSDAARLNFFPFRPFWPTSMIG